MIFEQGILFRSSDQYQRWWPGRGPLLFPCFQQPGELLDAGRSVNTQIARHLRDVWASRDRLSTRRCYFWHSFKALLKLDLFNHCLFIHEAAAIEISCENTSLQSQTIPVLYYFLCPWKSAILDNLVYRYPELQFLRTGGNITPCLKLKNGLELFGSRLFYNTLCYSVRHFEYVLLECSSELMTNIKDDDLVGFRLWTTTHCIFLDVQYTFRLSLRDVFHGIVR